MVTTLDLTERVLQMVSDVSATPIDELRPGHLLREDLNLDSVGSMELVSLIDEELGVEIDLDEALAVQTVADVMALLHKHAS